jgi:WD repeat-containing protein 42A
VRVAKVQDDGDALTTLLGEHDGRAHKLAIEPGSPYIFYSCGEDGLVQHVRTAAPKMRSLSLSCAHMQRFIFVSPVRAHTLYLSLYLTPFN